MNNIVHIIFSLNTGGAELLLIDIVNQLTKTHKTSLIIINNEYDQSLLSKISNSINIYKINRKRGSFSILSVLKLNYLLFKLNPKFIHCHNHNIVKMLFSKIFKFNLGLTVHAMGIEKKYFSKYNKLFAISNAVKNDIEKGTNYKANIVLNGIDFNNYKSMGHKKNNLFRIIQISRLEHEDKGQDVLIKSMNILINKYKIHNIRLDFIGSGHSKEYLCNLINKYNLSNNINLLGTLSRDKLTSMISEYDLLVQPSNYEGFGLTVVEGIASRVPVLVSNIDGPLEIIDNGKFGFYFDVGSDIDLSNKIIEIIKLSRSNSLSDIIERAYKYSYNKFHIKNTVNNYIKFYQKK